MKLKLFLSGCLSGCLLLMLSLIGCAEQTTSSTPEASSPPSQVQTSQALKSSPSSSPTPLNISSTPVSPTQKISADGIGAAQVGMTFGQLKKVLGANAEYKVQSPFMVDFDAIAVSESGKVQYYILYPAGTTFTNSQVIEALITENPNYRTDKGVGPGTPLKQAEAAYGDATLFFNTENETREYAKFVNQPSRNLSFRPTASATRQLAGIYSSSSDSYHETREYNPNASIRLVEVTCLGQKCQNP
jgi:hypothetical protein